MIVHFSEILHGLFFLSGKILLSIYPNIEKSQIDLTGYFIVFRKSLAEDITTVERYPRLSVLYDNRRSSLAPATC